MENEIIVNYNNWFILSAKIAIASMILPVLFAIGPWRWLTKPLKVFFYFCLATLLINLSELAYVYAVDHYTACFMNWLSFTNNSLNFLLIVYQLNSFLLLGIFYSIILSRFGHRNWVFKLSISLAFITLIAYVVEKGWRNYGTIGPSIESLFILFIPLFYLRSLSRLNLGIPLFKNSYFLISIGLFLPNLLGLFLFLMGSQLQQDYFYHFAALSVAKNIFLVAGNILFSISFYRYQFAEFSLPNK